MGTALAARIPLVCSRRPPGAPLGERVDLTAQASQPGGASHRDSMARAAGVLNFAALIASANGVPGFGAGHLNPGLMDTITTAVGWAEEHLRVLLRPATPS